MIKQPTYKRVLPLMLAALLGLGATSAQMLLQQIRAL